MSPLEPGGPRRPYRRVVLLGFMASGKSTVGRALADALGWQFVDLDDEIDRDTGLDVERIFAELGEPAFRSIEAGLTPRFTKRDSIVFAPGGGWVTNAGLLDGLPPDTLTVWLKASAAEILQRLSKSAEQPVRPLLSGEDREDRIKALLARREPLYGRASVVVETTGRPINEIVQQLTGIVRSGEPAAGEGNT